MRAEAITTMVQGVGLKARPLLAGSRMPLVVLPSSMGERDLAVLARANKNAIESWLLDCGALLFRGFSVSSAECFTRAVDALAGQRLDYLYRSTPRTHVGDRIFTATIYPPPLEIPLHQENAYQRDWPMRVCFYCAIPAESGGATPLADMRRVTDRLDRALVDRLEERQVKYIRHYRPGVDLPWQDVFQTQDKSELARFCAAEDIGHTWVEADLLRTEQICQGVSVHPSTGDRILFNQAHLFHVSHLGAETGRTMVEMFGADRLPRHADYGDGSPIPAEDLRRIREAFAAEMMVFPWQKGDVLLIDNMLVAHGRKPFSGKREVLAALSDPYSCWAARDPAMATG